MKVAVIGSGCSGLAATWLLNEYSAHQVYLFESDRRPGGHTNTVDFTSIKSKQRIPVDTGFIVFNPSTYPNFLRFTRDVLKLPLIQTDMSFGVSRDRGRYEWAGGSLSAVFAQSANLWKASQWIMIWDIIRFSCEAVDYIKGQFDPDESIGTYLQENGYSQAFKDNYILPMTAAIWSTPPDMAALDFPAATLIRFMHNHHLLQLGSRPPWLTVKNGSKQYVDAILSKLPQDKLHLNARLKSIVSRDKQVQLVFEDGQDQTFDRVILACHADTALALLGSSATSLEQDVLSQFEFGKNTAVLHCDEKLMPKRRKTWSAWNYLTTTDERTGKANVNKVALTYWMNLLQAIPESIHGLVAVTLNPPFMPDQDKTFGQWDYEHPYMSAKSIRAQKRLKEIQGARNIFFAGAWTNYGFHEDGFTSGLRAAAALGDTQCPFDIQPAERDLAAHQVSPLLKTAVSILELFRMLVVMVSSLLFSTTHSMRNERSS